MKAEITYTEISSFIEKECTIRTRFTTVDAKTVEISYKPSVFMSTISVTLHIETISNDLICLSYDCGVPASLIIAGAVAWLEEKIPKGIEVNTSNRHIYIYPQHFEQIEKVLEYVTLTSISFEEEVANIELTLA